MVYRLDDVYLDFPDPSEADEDGLIAVGGDLSFARLINAYLSGIFPWFEAEGDIFWYSLDPRMVLRLEDFRCSKSLRRVLQSRKFEVRCDTCFEEVVEACSRTPRKDQDGTWIDDDFKQAYLMLHQQGLCHSFETFYEDRLVGGLYGVSLGDMFSGESMFHTMTDASKVAFAALVEWCRRHEFRFIDAQQPTSHLASLGAKPVLRSEFLDMLQSVDHHKGVRGFWAANSVVLLIGGNQGDRQKLIFEAVGLIQERIGSVVAGSAIYETEPWGFEASQNFLNMGLLVDTNLSPEEVLRQALAIEADLGRVRLGQGYASRPMDIDLIFYNRLKICTPRLELPHPRMHLRRFVLRPLADIIPHYVHPVLKKDILTLLEDCPDTSDVEPFLF